MIEKEIQIDDSLIEILLTDNKLGIIEIMYLNKENEYIYLIETEIILIIDQVYIRQKYCY